MSLSRKNFVHVQFLPINLVAHLPIVPSFCPNQPFLELRALWLLQHSAQSMITFPLYQPPFPLQWLYIGSTHT